ncbi:hypothetical protein A5787_14235 [Mycobacterium sp. 852002-50816_SCH5313054-b]|uniref:hypothetical protein n=1 Tax=Mycobacterium sp. 852002-50816_SCH5313054-b TaxID=1834092 RepID=UPI0007FC2FF7|nr:hypothetical protein [Mycobacterium sp. 852002-50816_SCH5313054-b]OBF43908.1 hypothetical protein A5787_14235 [Mycobacterium sp. 852002-50816_SCH5313054-b]
MSLALALHVGINFDNAMVHCDNLIKVHEKAGTGTRGRKWIESSVNRAVIVLAVASWQAVVQDMTRFLLEEGTPQKTDPNYGFARLMKGRVMSELDRFSTPNADNSRNLLQLVGFDPRKYWTWNIPGRGKGVVTLERAQVEEQLRDWLKVRHAIAHGDAQIPNVAVLQAVRQGKVSPGQGPPIWLNDARNCTAFVKKLTKVTMDGLDTEL